MKSQPWEVAAPLHSTGRTSFTDRCFVPLLVERQMLAFSRSQLHIHPVSPASGKIKTISKQDLGILLSQRNKKCSLRTPGLRVISVPKLSFSDISRAVEEFNFPVFGEGFPPY